MNKNNPFVVSCEKSSFLIEKKLSGILSFKERRQLFIHTLMCDACRKYEKQSAFLDTLLRKKITVSKPTNAIEVFDKEHIEQIKARFVSKLH